MNKSERAALAALLDNVGLGFTKCLAETKLLRKFLRRTEKRPAPKPAFVFDPAALDAKRLGLHPPQIPAGLIARNVHWISESGSVMTTQRMLESPEGRFRPWAYTWVALAATVAPAKKAKAKR